jgi:ankyrin repeat protein
MILEGGADPTVQDKHGWTPFHLASQQRTCGSRSDDSRAGRRSDSAGRARWLDTIPLGVGRGHAEVVRMFLEQGADPTVQDKDGRTPFHLVSDRGHVEVVRMILEWGADPTVTGQGRPDTIPLGVARGDMWKSFG